MKRKCISLFTTLFAFVLSVVCFASCTKTVKIDGDYVVIVAKDVAADTTLADYMETLQADGDNEFTFTLENGMVTSINGKANPADYSSCWMLYTSDEDNSNTAWGTAEYDGKTYGSAMYGAEELVVAEGETYIWWYQTF